MHKKMNKVNMCTPEKDTMLHKQMAEYMFLLK